MITPYNAALAYRGTKRLRTAYAVGAYAWRHRGNIARGARVIQRAYRRYRRYKKRKRGYKPSKSYIGERVGSSNAKSSYTHKIQDDDDTKSLNFVNVTLIDRADQGINHLAHRQRNVINMRGFKVCFMARNNLQQPMLFNMAVLIAKGQKITSLADMSADFFRNSSLQELASANSRTTDFSTTLNSMELHCNPVNTDKFVVLKHWRKRIGPNDETGEGGSYNTQASKNWLVIDRYVKVNRQIRYSDDNQTPINGDIFLVWWFAPFLSSTTSNPVADALTKQLHTVAYWRETNT